MTENEEEKRRNVIKPYQPSKVVACLNKIPLELIQDGFLGLSFFSTRDPAEKNMDKSTDLFGFNNDDTVDVLVLYTGGTVGMKETSDGSLAPVKGWLPKQLARRTLFHVGFKTQFPLALFLSLLLFLLLVPFISFSFFFSPFILEITESFRIRCVLH